MRWPARVQRGVRHTSIVSRLVVWRHAYRCARKPASLPSRRSTSPMHSPDWLLIVPPETRILPLRAPGKICSDYTTKPVKLSLLLDLIGGAVQVDPRLTPG